MTTETFGDLTYWHRLQPIAFGTGWDPGWRPTGGALDDNIGRSDHYWGDVLQRARRAYGDPSMRYNTDDPAQDRYLVFGDGTQVPSDRSLAYHDSTTKTTYLLNTDGSVSPLGPDGRPGGPIVPAGLRRGTDGALAPIDATGHQVAPLVGQLPPAPHGYHDENGVLTPKNAAGDYYVLGPGGQRRYYDSTDAPITEDRFTTDGSGPPTATLDTGEQQSGRAAQAVHALQDALRGRYDDLGRAEDRLSEAMLTAHAATVDGRRHLDAIQHDIVTAVNDPSTSLEGAAGRQAYLRFLRGKLGEIRAVVDSGELSADDQAKVTEALSGLYEADRPSTTASDPAPAPAPAVAAAPPTADPAPAEAAPPVDLGPEPAMPDTTLSDVLGGPLGMNPMAGMASMLPGALGGLGGMGLGGGDPFGLSAFGGAASPLAGLISQLRERPTQDDHDDEDAPKGHAKEGDGSKGEDDGSEVEASAGDAASTKKDPAPAEPQPTDALGQGGLGGAPSTPVAPSTTVTLPDGSTTAAATPALAKAVSDYLSGTPVDSAYRDNGIDLPPPGTPVTDPADPSRLSCGFLGMYRDHYVVAASAVKAIQDGQVVPLSSVASSPDFLGWIDPTTLTRTAAPGVPK